MVIYCGIDVGIRNLAFCVIDSIQWTEYINKHTGPTGILEWQNLDLYPVNSCSHIQKTGKNKGKMCGKSSSHFFGDNGYCATHCTKYKCTKIKCTVNDCAIKAFQLLDTFDIFKRVSRVYIENQPSINQKMKMFAAKLEAYFLIRYGMQPDNIMSVHFSPAKKKLTMQDRKGVDTDHLKTPYQKRKFTAKKTVESYLQGTVELSKYLDNTKQDDLADALLHCIVNLPKTRLTRKIY